MRLKDSFKTVTPSSSNNTVSLYIKIEKTLPRFHGLTVYF